MIITLNGRAGGGKSSVAKALVKRLGYRSYSAGWVRREYALKQGMTLEELNKKAETDPASDFLVDDYMKKLGETEDNMVVEGRLCFLFIPKGIKIFLDADPLVRARRTMESDRLQETHKTIEEAVRKLKERDESDMKRYAKLYKVNPFDKKHYDLVIDTTENTVEETTDIVYDFVMERIKQKKM